MNKPIPTNTVEINAYVQVIGTKNKKRLTTAKQIHLTLQVQQHLEGFQEEFWIEGEIRGQFHEQFRKCLATTPELKNHIGSTQWEVQLMSYTKE